MVFHPYNLLERLKIHGLENDNTEILSCRRCREFLLEVHRFKIKCKTVDGIFRNNLDVKPNEIETIFRDAIEKNSSEIQVKSEVIDEFDETDQIYVEINKVEVEFDPLNIQQASESSVEDSLASNVDNVNQNDGDRFCRKPADSELEIIKKEFVQRHFKSNYHNDDYQLCNYGIRTGEDEIDAEQHGNIHSNEKPFSCELCSFTTSIKRYLKRHMLIHTKERPYVCDYCNYSAKTKSRIAEHIQIHLNRQYKPFKVSSGSLMDSSQSNDCDKPYKCGECSYATTTVSKLKSHARKHSDEKPYACDQCNYCSRRKIDLDKHLKTHLKNRDRLFQCGECSSKFFSQRELKTHISFKHTDEKPFSCDQCSYRCKFNNLLVRHKTIHLKESDKPYKPFSCDQCNYRSVRKMDLVKHLKIHMKDRDRPFQCGECSWKFFSQRELKTHISFKHSDEKPFSCDQCNYRCKFNNLLVRHKKIHSK